MTLDTSSQNAEAPVTNAAIVDELLYIVGHEDEAERRTRLARLRKEHGADTVEAKARYVVWLLDTLATVNDRLLQLTMKQREAFGYTTENRDLETLITRHRTEAQRLRRLLGLDAD